MEADSGPRSDPRPLVIVEVVGLSVYTHHGVSDAEQELGQRLELDIALDLLKCDATETDRLEDTANYSEVAEIATTAATEHSYRTLERVCQVIAGRLLERFPCESVRVRAAKPEPPMSLPVAEVAVEVTSDLGTAGDEGRKETG